MPTPFQNGRRKSRQRWVSCAESPLGVEEECAEQLGCVGGRSRLMHGSVKKLDLSDNADKSGYYDDAHMDWKSYSMSLARVQQCILLEIVEAGKYLMFLKLGEYFNGDEISPFRRPL